MPIIGLGTYKSNGNDAYLATKYAIEAGYRHIDTAQLYGNEKEIGRAIKEMIDGGKIKREDLFVVTKVAHTFHRYDRAILAVERSLHNLGLKYIDLVLIHYPVGFQEGENLWPVDSKGHIITSDIDYLETWRGLEETVNRKWVKSIGVSNFNSKQVLRIINNSKIKPTVNQVVNAMLNAMD